MNKHGLEWFDMAEQYDEMLYRGIRISGEDKSYFARRRVEDLRNQLGDSFIPRTILDFGCGNGDTTSLLAEKFPESNVIGVDLSTEILKYAEKRQRHSRVVFLSVEVLTSPRFSSYFDLCYSNGVFHHIVPEERISAIQSIYQSLAPGGIFAFFENNPWNPGTRVVMSRIPFDQDAQPLSFVEARHLLRQGCFSVVRRPRFLFYFPRFMAILRFLEPIMVHIPLGAQYYLLGKKEALACGTSSSA